MYDDRCSVRITVPFAAGEPAPATIRILHVSQTSDTGGYNFVDFRLAKHRIGIVAFPLLSSFLIITNLLGVEIGSLFANLI